MGRVSVVIKVGGGLLADPGGLDTALVAIETISRDVSLIVVPGGGPFADAVRDIDRRLHLSDDAAHWMAVLAMDQYAHLIGSRLRNAGVITGVSEIAPALDRGVFPVLAPYQWLRDADPLPHSWDVTSDSISAWIAGQVGAARLVLVKPSGASGRAIVDPYFDRVLPTHINASFVTVDRIAELERAIAAPVI